MQLVTMLGQMLESGKLTLSTNNKEDLEVTAANKKIDVNLKDKEFIKSLVSEVLKSNKNTSTIQTINQSSQRIKAARNMREMLIDTANELSQAGLTVTLSYKADLVATAGAQANSGISRLLTGTKALEINSLSRLAELGIYIL
jgi:beta-glucosidase-like glycosyl hydrolase